MAKASCQGLGKGKAPKPPNLGAFFCYKKAKKMEHPGITIYRRHMATVIGERETYGREAEPHLSELKDFLGERIPRAITIEQELKAAIELHRLVDPDVARGRRVKRVYGGGVQVTFSREQYDLLRSSAFAPLLEALEQGTVGSTPGART